MLDFFNQLISGRFIYIPEERFHACVWVGVFELFSAFKNNRIGVSDDEFYGAVPRKEDAADHHGRILAGLPAKSTPPM